MMPNVRVAMLAGVFLAGAGQGMAHGAEKTGTGAKAMFFTDQGKAVVAPAGKPVRTPAAPRQSPDGATTANRNDLWLGVAFWAELQRPGAAITRIANPAEFMFRSGDRIRLLVQTNIDGFLYVINRGSTGRYTLLFPQPSMEASAHRVKARTEYAIPHNGWIRFDEVPGEEGVVFLVTLEPLPELTALSLARAAVNPETVRHVMDAADSRGAKDLVVETDEGDGRQATFAGAYVPAAASAAGGERDRTLIVVRTQFRHQ